VGGFIASNHLEFWNQHMDCLIGPILGAVVAALIYDNLVMAKK
jgi:glycerol uptake facilitator-like aquaporin